MNPEELKHIVNAVVKTFKPTTRERIKATRFTHNDLQGQRFGQFLINRFYKGESTEFSQIVFNAESDQAVWEGIYA